MRKKPEKRKKLREKRKEQKDVALQQKKEELKRLKNLKKQEIYERMKAIKEIAGVDNADFDGVDLDGDFDPNAHDRQC